MPQEEEKKEGCGVRLAWFLLAVLGITVCLIGGYWLDHEEMAMPTFVFCFSLISGVQMEWKWRRKVWFWGVIAFVALADIVLLLSIGWPHHVGRGRGKLEDYLIALGNLALFGALFWITRRICEGKPASEPVLCRACQQEVEKNALRCPHCGEWKPGPLPAWPLLIVFGPIVLMMVGMAFTIDWNAPEDGKPAPEMNAYAPGQVVSDAMHRSVVRTILRAEHLPCDGALTVTSRGGASWIVVCDNREGTRRYAVYPRSGAVRACPDSANLPCE